MGAITCTTKGWNWKDVLRGWFTNGFTAYDDVCAGTTAGESGRSSLKLVQIEDAGGDYFDRSTPDRTWQGWDHLFKLLTDFYEGSEGETALRVSLGVPADDANRCALPDRGYTPEEFILKCIGVGTDGGPVLRISILLCQSS